jgi:hypothetical protein
MSFFESYQQTAFFIFDPLEFPSSTEPAEVYVINYLSTRNYTLYVSVTNIDESVVVRLEGTLDGVNYAPMLSEIIKENGDYAYNSYGFPMKKVRATFHNEIGGTNAVVAFKIAAN